MKAYNVLLWFVLIFYAFGPKYKCNNLWWKNECKRAENAIEDDDSALRCACIDDHTKLECKSQEGEALFYISAYINNKLILQCYKNKPFPESIILQSLNLTKGSYNELNIRDCAISQYAQVLDVLGIDKELKTIRIRAGDSLTIDNKSFIGISDKFPQLQKIKVYGDTKKVTLEEGAFDDFIHITQLVLEKIDVYSIPHGLFDHMKNLQKLVFEDVGIKDTVFKNIFDNLNNLKDLRLEKMRGSSMQEMVNSLDSSNLHNLQTLTFKKCSFHDLPRNLLKNNCDNLERFFMQKDTCDNCVRHFDANFFTSCQKIKEFMYEKDSSSNHEVTISNELFGVKNVHQEYASSLQKITLQNINLAPNLLGNLFQQLESLVELDLENTSISSIKVTDFPPNLRILHLEDNPLNKTCNCSIGLKLKELNDQIGKNTGSQENIHIGTSNRSPTCPCNGTRLDLLKFYTCSSCIPPTPQQASKLSAFITLTLIIVVLTAILVVICVSERVRVWLYHHQIFSKCFRSERNRNINNEGDNLYDAFVSYSEKDNLFVEKMVKILESPTTREEKQLNLEQLGGRRYKFCIHERDWAGGKKILDNITDSVKNSFRTIILLSKNFANSEWCQHEFDEAYKENKVIIVMLEGTTISDFDGNDIIQSHLRSVTYLKQEDPKLWKKLSYQLPHKQMEKRSQRQKAMAFLRQITEELPLVRYSFGNNSA